MQKFNGAGGAHLGIGMGFGRRGPLLNLEGAGGGGGAGGTLTPGQPAGGAGAGDGSLSEGAKKEVADLVNQAVNGAVTNHLTRFKKSFTEEITATLGTQLGPIGEQLKLLAERPQPTPGAGAPGGKAREYEMPQEVKDSLLRNEARIKELEQQNKQEREARETERQTRLREEERGKLAGALRERGLPDAQIRAVTAVLHTEDKRISRTEDGRIVFKTTRGTGQAQYVDEQELDKGVDEWLRSDEGKAFVPARTAQGSGGAPARPGQAPRTPGEAKAQATQTLAKILLGG